MNRSHAYRTLVLLVSLSPGFACQAEAPPADEESPPLPQQQAALVNHPLPPGAVVFNNTNRFVLGGSGTTITDWSGDVQVRIWGCHNDGNPVPHPVVTCSVDSGWVLIGGGATAFGSASAGALLTASFPTDPAVLTTWEARSKDHIISNSHVLAAWAIGLQLKGLTRDQLAANMAVRKSTGEPAHHPSASVPAFTEHAPISGGSIVDWRGSGSMLTFSHAGAAEGKDHGVGFEEIARITHYAIGLKPNIPGFGRLNVVQEHGVVNGAGHLSVPISLANKGVVPTGFGGLAGYLEPGGMLTRMGPRDSFSPLDYLITSKDHVYPASGTLIGLVNTLARAR